MSTVGANLSASATERPKFLQLVTCRSVRRWHLGYPSLDSEFYSSDDEAWDEEVPAENSSNWLAATIHAEDLTSSHEFSTTLTAPAPPSLSNVDSDLIGS